MDFNRRFTSKMVLPGIFLRHRIIHSISSAALLFQMLACSTYEQEKAFYMPAEFEEQQAVWLGWEGYEPYYSVGATMIESLLPYVDVKIISESDSVMAVCKEYLAKRNIDTAAIKFYSFPDNEFWVRDHGGTYIKNAEGQLKVVDFGWNSYGSRVWLLNLHNNNVEKVDSILAKYPMTQRGKIDSLMATTDNLPVIKSTVTIEGGAIEVNGRGTLLLNEPLTLSRNEGMTKEAIEKEFKRVLGLTNVIWLKEGLAEDPHIWQKIVDNFVGLGTGGHTDEFVRFADENTILLAWVDESDKDKHPLNRMNYDRMTENLAILERAKNEKGEPFRIVKVPLPDPIVKPVRVLKPFGWDDTHNIAMSVFRKSDGFSEGDTVLRVAASSYLNYFVTNGAVILPSYLNEGTSPETEKRVEKIFTEVFPGRKLIFIDAMNLNWEGGGIHCGTQQQPK